MLKANYYSFSVVYTQFHRTARCAGCGGNRDDLTARVLVKSTCFRTGNRWLRAANRDREPKIKTPHGRFNFWLCSVCGSRTNLQEILSLGQEIEQVKDKLRLVNLN